MLESNQNIAAQYRINEYNAIISKRLDRLDSLFNFDETGVNYDAPGKYTVNEKGARSVAVGTSGHERLRSTVLPKLIKPISSIKLNETSSPLTYL